MLRALSSIAALGALAIAVPAQTCSVSGDRFLQNDTLPMIPPPSPTAVSVIQGICENEAAFNVFDNVQGNITVNEVSVMLGAAGGVNGQNMVVGVEFYDGVTENVGGVGQYQMGPLLWSLANNGGASAQIQSHAFNVIDLVPFNVDLTVNSGKLVVAVRIEITTVGSCLTGHSTNLCTDYPGFGTQCPPVGTTGILALPPAAPAFDPATYPFPGALGLTLCHPLVNAFGGSWLIRACITEENPPALTTWQGFPQPGGAVLIQLNAPSSPNGGFVTLLGGSANVGTPTPWGTWPIDLDPLALCFLGECRGLLSNGEGALDPNGQAITTFLIPADPNLVGSGLTLWPTFFAYAPGDFFNWTDIGALPQSPIVIN